MYRVVTEMYAGLEGRSRGGSSDEADFRNEGAQRMKDRIGNTLAKGDKVVLQLPDPMVFGYVAEVQEPNHLVRVTRPGHILVTAVIALPAMEGTEDTVLQVAKVYDAQSPAKPSEPSQGTSDAPKPN